MKILMATHTKLPDNRIDREATSLAQHGFSIYIICVGLKGTYSNAYSKIYTIELNKREKSLLPIAAKKVAKKYRKIIDEVQPDIIHAHDIMAANIIRHAIPRKIKFVYDTHEDWELLRKRQRKVEPNLLKKLAVIFYTYPSTKRVTRKIAKKADLIVLTTKFSINYFENFGIPRKQIITVENYASQEIINQAIKRVDLIDEFMKKDQRKKIVHSSKSIKISSKIVRDVSVYAEAANELDDWVLVVFGPEDEKFIKIGVKFLPPRDQIAYLASISKCNVALNPLILDERTHYSSSNRIFEFVSLGLKVISSKAKYLEDKFNDYLIWAGPDASKEDIKEILNNIEKYPTKEELIKIGKKYSWEQEIQKLVDSYHKLVNFG
ncbi:MAG: glycosyltransferase family 4 protein [Asgard group archaeon]|nr:glycosyltransferase family 4 protein [Asgard group archaeon]